MRYRKYVSLSMHELSQLLVAWNKFAENPEELGESVLGTSYPDLIKELDSQCNIQLSLPQLFNLCYYYKHGVLEKLSHNHKRLPPNYNQLMASLAKQLPELFETTGDGEVRMKEGSEVTGIYDDGV